MPSASEILAARLASRSRQTAAPLELEDDSPEGILSKIGGYGLGVIGAVGNTLDLPASSLRDVLSSAISGEWKNPFDQWLTPFSAENRTTGRDLLTDVGFRPNQDSTLFDWVDDPIEGVLDVAGLVTEVVLDPLNPARWAVGGLTGLNTGLRSAVRNGSRIAVARSRDAINVLPGGDRFTSAVSQALTRARDVARRRGRQFFDPEALGTYDARAQRYATHMSRELLPSQDEVRSQITAAARYLDENNYSMRSVDNDTLWKKNESFRAFLEGEPAEEAMQTTFADFERFPEELRTGPVLALRSTLQRFRRSEGMAALNVSELVDKDLEYWPRRMVDALKQELKDQMGSGVKISNGFAALTTNSGDIAARELLYKGYSGGTGMLQRIITDNEAAQLIEEITGEVDKALVPNQVSARAAGYAVPRHIQPFAEALGITENELWKELGLSVERPYARAGEVVASLNRLRERMRQGIASSEYMELAGKPMTVQIAKAPFGKGYNYQNVFTGRSTPIRFEDGVPVNLPDGEVMTKVTDTAFIQQWREALAKEPEALQRFEQAVSNDMLYQWTERGGKAPTLFAPQLQSVLENQLGQRMKGLSQRIKKLPASEEEMVVPSLTNLLRRKYGDVIDDNMPHVITTGDRVGEFSYYVRDADGNVMQEFSLPKGKALEADRNPEIFQQMLADKFPDAAEITPRYDSRVEALSEFMVRRENARLIGMFGNNPLVDLADSLNSSITRVAISHAMQDMTYDSFVRNYGGGDQVLHPRRVATAVGQNPTGKSVADMLTGENGINQKEFVQLIRKRLRDGVVPGTVSDEDLSRAILNTYIDHDVYDEMDAAFQYFRGSPEEQAIGKGIDTATSIFKAGVLSTPRTVVRDALSALIMSVSRGDLPISMKGVRRWKDAFMMARGRMPSDPMDMPVFRQMAAELGLDPDSASDRAKALLANYTGAMNQSHLHGQLTDDFARRQASGQIDDVLEAIPGYAARNEGMLDSAKRLWGENQSLLAKVAPWNVPGVPTLEDGRWVNRSTMNTVARFHNSVRGTLDNANRLAAIKHLMMDKGMTFREAFERASSTQLNYDPRTFTRFEKTWMKRVFPFYSFISRSLPMVAMDLASAPGGPLGRVIRAQRLAQGDDQSYVPYDLMDTAAIPLGESENGDLNYLTNLGLMHEDALRYLAPVDGVRGLLKKVVGSANPLVKGLIEYSTNTSTFFDGPMGGRRLDDLDPAIGRLLVNLGVRDLQASGRPAPFGGPAVEAVVANSPLSAALSYARTISEPLSRRGLAEKTFNLLTGVRTRKVTPEQLARELRDRLNARQIELGARPLTIVAGSKQLQEAYQELGDPQSAEQLRLIEQGLTVLRKRLQERAKAK